MFEIKIKKIPTLFLGYVLKSDEKTESLIERFPKIVEKKGVKKDEEIINLAAEKGIEITEIKAVKELKKKEA